MKSRLRIAFAVVSMMCAAGAGAQSVDSLWGFRQARSFTEQHQKKLLVPLTAATIGAQGYLHAAFYSQGEYADIHLASEILGATHFATSYVAGLDPAEAYGASMVGTFVFQMFINASFGMPLVNPREARRYDVGGMDWTWKRPFVGYGRWAQLGIGTALILHRPIIRGIRRLL